MSWWVNSWISVGLVTAVPTQPAASQGEGCSLSEGWYVNQHFLLDFPFDDIYRRLLFFTLIRYVCPTLAKAYLCSKGSHLLRVTEQKRMIPGTTYIHSWYVHQHFLFDFPHDDIYRRLLFFTLTRYGCTTLAVVLLIVQLYRYLFCLLYTSPSPRDKRQSRMPSSA